MYSFAWTKPAMWFTQYRSDGRYTPGSSPGQARFRPPPPYTRSAVRGAAPLHDVALVVGMAIDKMLLLMGDAPANTEHTERGIYTNLRYEPDVQDAEYEEEDDGDIVEESEPSPSGD